MQVRSSYVLLLVMTFICFGAFPGTLAAVAGVGPDRLEIVHSSTPNDEVRANVTQAQLVRNIYQAVLSLPTRPKGTICPLYIRAQYQLTFLHGSSSVLRATVQEGGCSTVSLGQGNLRMTTPAFWSLLERTHALGDGQPQDVPAGLGPGDLQNAYDLPSATAGTGQTVAIVDAYDNPNAEADMTTYRSAYALSPCTSALHCFRKVDERGGKHYPGADAAWAGEISLDLDMVSAICPHCHILLVEANTAAFGDLGRAVETAVRMGATSISNSYGAPEDFWGAFMTAHYYNHPGVAITVSSGDSGYGVQLPAAFNTVIAVGGTSLSHTNSTRGWIESAWSGAGSGCSQYISKPSWQKDSTCTTRSVVDVSAVADPLTGVAIYNTYQSFGDWFVYGGTSASSPIIASIYALVGKKAHTSGSYLYQHSQNFSDVTDGSNGTCPAPYLCTAGSGYDGPTGLGTPNGIDAF